MWCKYWNANNTSFISNSSNTFKASNASKSIILMIITIANIIILLLLIVIINFMMMNAGRVISLQGVQLLVVALEHSRVLAIFCSTVFTSDHPSTMCTLYPLNTRVVWSENHATFNREYSRVLECHLLYIYLWTSSYALSFIILHIGLWLKMLTLP